MKKDKDLTVVTFYKEEDGQILAVFPKIPYTGNCNRFQAYSTIGQHSCADPEYLLEYCKPCELASEYQELKKELEGLDYNLKITNVTPFTKKKKKSKFNELASIMHPVTESNVLTDEAGKIVAIINPLDPNKKTFRKRLETAIREHLVAEEVQLPNVIKNEQTFIATVKDDGQEIEYEFYLTPTTIY